MSVIAVYFAISVILPVTEAKANLNHKHDLSYTPSEQNHIINVANKNKTYDVNIKGQPLSSALKELHKQTGVYFIFPTEQLKNVRTKGVSGKLTGKAALKILLKDTGLSHKAISDEIKSIRVAQAGDEILLDGITVYGEKTERDLQDTTTSVQVFTSEDLENSTAQDIDDVLDQSANVIQRSGGEGFAIRGINNTSVSGIGSGPLASLYIDGAAISGFGIRVGIEDLWDVEQIEVLKGPQSTTQGRNTLAGAIIVKTKDPTYEYEALVRGGIASENSALFSAVVNAPIIDNKLAIRLAVDLNKTDGHNTNETLGIDDQAFKQNQSFRGKVLFEPTKDFTNIVTLTFSRNESGDEDVDRDLYRQRQFFGNVQGGEDHDQFISTIDSSLRLNDNWSVKNIISFNRSLYDQIDDNDGHRTGGNTIGDPNLFVREIDTDTFTEELRLHYEAEGIKAHFGAYYARIETDLDQTNNLVIREQELEFLGLTPLAPFYNGVERRTDLTRKTLRNNFAGFGEVNYDVSNFLTVFAGLRYDREEFETSSITNIENQGLPNPALCGPFAANCTFANNLFNENIGENASGRVSATSEAWLPSAGFTLNWSDDLSTGFFVKRGYRSGGAGVTGETGEAFEFDPEFVWNYEFSFRSQWFDKKLTLNSNVFYMDWTDQQVSVALPILPGGTPVDTNLATVNAGRSTLKGFEVEAFAQPTDQLKLRGSVGYVKTEFEDFVTSSGNFSGNEFPNAPEWTIAGSARYSFDNGVYLHVDANYQSESFSLAQNRPLDVEEARTLVNAKIGYKTESLDAYIFSTNLFDEEYIANSVQGSQVVKIGDGRTVGVRVNMKLD